MNEAAPAFEAFAGVGEAVLALHARYPRAMRKFSCTGRASEAHRRSLFLASVVAETEHPLDI
jgi:hypothetical protein